MTSLLLTFAGVIFAYSLYIASLCGRNEGSPSNFIDAGMTLPGWAAIFAGTGIVLAGLNLHDHFRLVSSYGLQASHVAVGLVLVALTGALVRKRVWLASRISGLRTVGDIMGTYYGSVSLRIILLVVLFLFSVPLAAYALGEIGELVAAAANGAIPRDRAIWIIAFFLFLSSVLGGWRATVYIVGAQGFLLITLLVVAGAFALLSIDRLELLSTGIPSVDGILTDRIPGVIQFSAGIGKEVAFGGIWTTVAIVSFALSLIGIVLSPGFAFLGITIETRRGFAFEQVWMTTGLGIGLLVLLAPVIGAAIAADGYVGLAARLSSTSPLVGVAFLCLMLVSLQIGVAFFVTSGAHVAAVELVGRYILPDLDARGLRLATRIMLAVTWLVVSCAASATPLASAIIAPLALPLAAQLLPAYLGLCWLPWISRSGVLTGFTIGALLVVFTEPFGLIAFEGLFLDLPWGRWPLTVHSAAWGLAFNMAFCLLASLFTRAGPERERRQRLHDEFAARHRVDFGGRAARTAKWSLVLIWAFLALGPGAILGNNFFSQPIFSGTDVVLGLPSLMVWQFAFWLIGVFLVWWLAYQTRMSVIGAEAPRAIRLDQEGAPAFGLSRPPWIARLLGRVAGRG